MKLALTLTILLVPLAACMQPGDGQGEPFTDTSADQPGCPTSVRDLDRDLCTGRLDFALLLTDCASTSMNYEVPKGQGGPPPEWGTAGNTPATDNAYSANFVCPHGALSGHDLGALNLGVVAGVPANYPPPPQGLNHTWSAGYASAILTESVVLADYLAWKGFPAEVAILQSVTMAGVRLTWTGDGWESVLTCSDMNRQGPDTGETWYWHGSLADPATLSLLDEGTLGLVGIGTVDASGGPHGEQTMPLGRATGYCVNSHDYTVHGAILS